MKNGITSTKSLSTVDLLDFNASLGKRKKSKGLKKIDFSKIERYNATEKEGLTSDQVEKRFAAGLTNQTKNKGGKTYFQIICSNIFTYINLLVFIVFAGMLLVVTIEDYSKFLFVIIITANIVIGIVQECKSKATIDKLKIVTAPTALVVRNGEIVAIHTKDVVLDDIIYVEMGKQICADSLVIAGDFEVNESMLTGESVSVHKKPGDMIFAGSYVTSGSGHARVEKIGELNYIETLSSYAKKYKRPKSEINDSITAIIIAVSCLMLPLAVLMIVVNYNKLSGNAVYAGLDPWNRGQGLWYDIIIKASGSMIGMIPSGMFLLTSVALVASVLRLAQKKTLVQDLHCIEMLARVDTLCLDKTGTITDGTMKVKKVLEIKGGDENGADIGDVIGSFLASTGDNNQTAIALSERFGYNLKYNAVSVIPFSSQRKMSAVTFEGIGTYILGAPEIILGEMGSRISSMVEENAAQGYRVLCLAHNDLPIKGDKIPSVKRPVCLIVIEDHIRDEACGTIKWFRDNDVAVKIISGDNPITVSEVARRAGVPDADKYISADGLSNKEILEIANKYTVFGRVSPEQKSILIKAMKSNGHTVAMTGDGVNDILAMKQSDCAISVASGAEAARNVAHLVLLDNNFNSLPEVVAEGRRVINNIAKSSSLFLMKTFMTIVLSVICLAIGSLYFFSTNMTMMFEMFVIAFPSFMLALQGNKNRVKEGFLKSVIKNCVPGGLTITIAVISVFVYWMLALGHSDYTAFDDKLFTMLTITLTYSGLFVLFRIAKPYNAYRIFMIVLAVIVCLAGTFVPGFNGLFDLNLDMLSLQDVLFMLVVMLSSYYFSSFLYTIVNSVDENEPLKKNTENS